MTYRNAPRLQKVVDRLRIRGFRVDAEPGWESRGRAEMGTIEGHTVHHTVDNPSGGEYPSLDVVCYRGRPDLGAPLSQWGTGRTGIIHLFAAGVANHAGASQHPWQTNTHMMGNEIANNGVGEPYPPAQIAAAVALAEELQFEFGFPEDHIVGHKESCYKPGRKSDPSFDMNHFRDLVGTRPGPVGVNAGGNVVVVPVVVPVVPSPVDESRRPPDHLPVVSTATAHGDGWAVLVQRLLATQGRYRGKIDGWYGAGTKAAVAGLQGAFGLKADGIVGQQTWCLGLLAGAGTLRTGDSGVGVELLQNLLGYRPGSGLDGAFGPGTAGRLKQVQRWGGLTGEAVDGIAGPQARGVLARG